MALQSALAEGDGLGRAVSHVGLGVAYRQAQRVAEAIQAERDALDAARAIADRRQEAAALTLLGHAQRRGRRLDLACSTYGEALAVAERASLVQWSAWATIGLAGALFDAGRGTEARAALDRLRATTSARFPGLHAERLRILAALEREAGQLAAAEASIREAMDIAQAADNAVYAADFGVEYGRILMAAGEGEKALATLAQALDLQQRIGDRSGEAGALDVVGEAYAALGRFEEAVAAHANAASAHLVLEDPWRAAAALANLGRLRSGVDPTSSAENLRQALELLNMYSDPRALALRSEIAELLNTLNP
jgi:tetratricopeptide (TPR) repeat protein